MEIIEERVPLRTVRAWRLWVLLALALAGFLALAWRLWHVQVLDSAKYGAALHTQSLRTVQTVGARGRILDRNGNVLADNRPAWSVVIHCGALRQPGDWNNTVIAVDAVIDELASRLGRPRQVSRADVRRHVLTSMPMPLEIWSDVDFRTVAYLSEWAGELPGVELEPVPFRLYPYGTLAAHVLGYVGAPERREPAARAFHYRMMEQRGRAGLEKHYDALLAGTNGERFLRVDSLGCRREVIDGAQARPGNDLTLTLDIALQRTAEAALAGCPGAVVALDPRNGDVLVLASSPTYDLNGFVPSIPRVTWNALLANPDTPLLNRVIQAQYAPGSVFKPFVAIAALENGKNPDLLYDCTGIYTDHRLRLRCASRYGHGEVDLRQALMKSCNPYFCNLGTQTGIAAIENTARQAGFGSLTGIDLPGEAPGILPTPEWMQRKFRRAWTPADTAQTSIGQGALLVTPLQVAHAVGALAVGGTVCRPRLVSFGDARGDIQRHLRWDHANLRAVIEGMCAVVGPGGTGRTMQVEGVAVAGKTGTAEYIDRGVRRKHVWCAAFAPAERPEIVVVAMLDNGTGGGVDAGPIVQRVLADYFRTVGVETALDEEELQD